MAIIAFRRSDKLDESFLGLKGSCDFSFAGHAELSHLVGVDKRQAGTVMLNWTVNSESCDEPGLPKSFSTSSGPCVHMSIDAASSSRRRHMQPQVGTGSIGLFPPDRAHGSDVDRGKGRAISQGANNGRRVPCCVELDRGPSLSSRLLAETPELHRDNARSERLRLGTAFACCACRSLISHKFSR